MFKNIIEGWKGLSWWAKGSLIMSAVTFAIVGIELKVGEALHPGLLDELKEELKNSL